MSNPRPDPPRLAAIREALEAVEWTGDVGIHSPVCHWCRGYQRQPTMDQDYYGKPGHKPDCPRQQALAAVEALLADLRRLEAQYRAKLADMRTLRPNDYSGFSGYDRGVEMTLEHVADDLAALLARLEGQ